MPLGEEEVKRVMLKWQKMIELQLCLAASNSCAGRMDATVERQGLEALIGYGLEAFRASIIRRRGPMWRRERGEERRKRALSSPAETCAQFTACGPDSPDAASSRCRGKDMASHAVGWWAML
jgi:hypothetical protein